jgi:hypothetical protein
LADCATTSHISSEKNNFTVYRKIDKTINGVGDARVKAVGCGSVILTSHVDGETHIITLNDVLHVPTATDNLLSIGRFVERGNTFVTTKLGAFLFDSNENLVAIGQLDNGLFPLDVEVTQEISNVATSMKCSWMEWHKRFGHIAISGLQHLRRRNLVDSFDVDESSELRDCEACVRAKQTENPFSKSATRSTTHAGELTHTDIWGPAALHAGYLRNRAYTRTLSHQTPLERWSGKRPDVTSLQEFGMPVSILNQGVGQDKLDPRGDIHIFVGFEDGPHAIRYFDVTTHQVKISRNYHFLPHSDNPPQFEGEYLGENESLWENLYETEQQEPENRFGRIYMKRSSRNQKSKIITDLYSFAFHDET